jgi:FdhD protein
MGMAEARLRGGRPARRLPVVRVAVRAPSGAVATEGARDRPAEARGGDDAPAPARTPSASGHLLGEAIVAMDDVARVAECRAPEGDGGIADVRTRTGAASVHGLQRRFYTTSSCGICGKQSIEAVRVAAAPLGEGPRVEAAHLHSMPGEMRERQRGFARTGGLHAAGLFAADGGLVELREDVGA